MALGKLSDTNLAVTSILTGGAWSGVLPLSNLIIGDYLARPARQLAPATLSGTQFKVQLASVRAVSLIGLLFHTLSLSAKYRVTFTNNLGVAQPSAGWRDVYPRYYATSQIDYEQSNWWDGRPLQEDLVLYPRHLWIPVTPAQLVSSFVLELNDSANTAGYFDLGGLWVAATWSPAANFDRGRESGPNSRDLSDESPSGKLFFEERAPRRSISVTWSGLTDEEALRIFDAGARARTTRPLIFAPDTDYGPGLLREAYPATFEILPRPRFSFNGLNTVSATLKELLA